MKFSKKILIFSFLPLIFIFGGNKNSIGNNLINKNNEQRNILNLDGFYLKDFYPLFSATSISSEILYVYTDGTRDVVFNNSSRTWLSPDSELLPFVEDRRDFLKPVDFDGDDVFDEYQILDVDSNYETAYVLAKEVVTGDNVIFSWGRNDNGQLVNGTFNNNFGVEWSVVSNNIYNTDEFLNFNEVVDIDANWKTFYIMIDNKDGIEGNDFIYSAGSKYFGQAGNGSELGGGYENFWAPVELPEGKNIVSMDMTGLDQASGSPTYAIIEDGGKNIAYGWGKNYNSQIAGPDKYSNNDNIRKPQIIDADGNGVYGDEDNLVGLVGGQNFSVTWLKESDGSDSLYFAGIQDGYNISERKKIEDFDGDGTIGNEKIDKLIGSRGALSVVVENNPEDPNDETKTLYNYGYNGTGRFGNGDFVSIDSIETPFSKSDVDGDGIIGNEEIVDVKISPINRSTYVFLKDSYGISSIYFSGVISEIVGNGTPVNSKNTNSKFIKSTSIKGLNSLTLENIEKTQNTLTFEIGNTFLLGQGFDWIEDLNNLEIVDNGGNYYDLDVTNLVSNGTFVVKDLEPGKNYFFEWIDYENETVGLPESNGGNVYDFKIWNKNESFITDYQLNGFSVLSTSKTSANLKFDLTTTNFGAYSDQERTININYDYEELDEGGSTIESGSGTWNNLIIDKSGELFIDGLIERTNYTITSIEYNNSYSLVIDSINGEIIETQFESLFLVNETFEIDEITKNSLKFSLNVFDEGDSNFINEYDFIYLFFKNTKGGDSPLIAYRLNDGSGSGEEKTYQFEVRNLSSGTEYELLGLSLNKNFGFDGEGNDESFKNSVFIETKFDEVKSKDYIYIILVAGFMLLLVFILFMFLFIKNVRKSKAFSKASKKYGL